MSTLLTLHPIEGHLGADPRHRPILYCPTTLACGCASWDLSDALYSLHAPLESVSAHMDEIVVEHQVIYGERADEDGNEFVAVPQRSFGRSLLLVTAAQLLTIPWDQLSEDPRGKILKGAAWAYLAALPPDTQIVVHLSH